MKRKPQRKEKRVSAESLLRLPDVEVAKSAVLNNLRLGAVRRLAYEASDCGLLSADLATGIRRVKGVKKLDVRLGNLLTAEQGQTLWQAPDRKRLKGNVIGRCLPSCCPAGSVDMNSPS
jgi:hypothetical protein